MFSSGLVNNLDNLAREGVIDFDATAFITGTKPRYVGNPSYAPLPMPEMTGVSTENLKQPTKDEMVWADPEKNGVVSKNPLWKKILFGTMATGLIVLGGWKLHNTKFFSKIPQKIGNMFKSIPNMFKNMGKTVIGWFKKLGNAITGLFKKKPAPTP